MSGRFCAKMEGGKETGASSLVKEITCKELKAKIDRGDDFYLVEALPRWHYEMSHLPRAIKLPYEFIDEAEKVLPDKRAQIVVY